MKFKISVVIPVYNAENTLEDAINSILSQNWDGDLFNDVEVILVDDNSSDSSLDIIKKFCSEYDNIKYYSFLSNSGYGGRGRNKGIELADSNYIILLDNDDIYLPNALKTMFNAINNENADFVGFSYKDDIFENKHYVCPNYGDKISIKPTKSQKIFDLAIANSSYAPWAKIYNKQFLDENNIRFLEDSQFDDAYFFIKCLLAANKYSVYPNEFVYMYFTYEDSQVRAHDKIHFYNRLSSLKKCVYMIEEQGLSSNTFANHCFADFLLIFSNSNESRKDKLNMLEDLYNFEKDYDITLELFELKFLNWIILKKYFSLAIWIGKFYSVMYNNNVIRNIYRKRNFIKLSKK